MIRFFAGHPTAANLLMGVLLLVGLFVLPSMKRETMPTVEQYEVQVSVAYPGASALEIEDSICQLLEEATDGITFTSERRCDARDNVGTMVLEMLEAGNMPQFVDDVKTAVDSIDEFPEESEDPVVEELGRVTGVVNIAVLADLPLPQLNAIAEDYKQRLLRLPEVSIVRISGFSDHQLKIEVSEQSLRQYGLSVTEMANIIGQQSLEMPAGTVEGNKRDYQLRVTEARRTVDELTDLVVLRGDGGTEVRLGQIATVHDGFELEENKVEFDGRRAAILEINKNKIDDSLRVLDSITAFVDAENQRLPEGIELVLTQDQTSIVRDRLMLMVTNAWQGLILVAATLYLFFSGRYTLWVTMGLPVSFLGSFALITAMGVSINMISLVGLLIAIGILMDDAIVISESIASCSRSGMKPLEAVVEGTKRVTRGVLSSFFTTVMVFGGLMFIEGDMGQVLKVMPMVLIAVLLVSLVEAFLILPSHLLHSLHHQSSTPLWKQRFEVRFERWREAVGQLADTCIRYRYSVVGGVLALFLVSAALLPSGVVKFRGFPDLDGDILQARIIMPQGTPLAEMERVVQRQVRGLEEAAALLSEGESEPLIRHVKIAYGVNADAFENGPHIATLSVDLLSAEDRNTAIDELRDTWRDTVGSVPGAIAILYKEPTLGPAGRAISFRLKGDELTTLMSASEQLKRWLNGYEGVIDVLDDLRPGKPQFKVRMREGAFATGIDVRTVANQLRAAYQGVDVDEIQFDGEGYEVQVRLDEASRSSLAVFDNITIVHPQTGQAVPLISIATIESTREYARVQRIDGRRTVSVFGDVLGQQANASEIVADIKQRLLPQLKESYPGIDVTVEGETKNSAVTGKSIARALLIGAIAIYLLLSLQFRSYVEPLIVMVAIPLAFIGVIWGHLIMGLEMSMPSMMGLVSLAGIVVNDSILLVEFVKLRVREGMSVHDAASQASRDRFRAIFLTSLTTVAGLLPLLFETSLQAQILVPLVTSIIFGISVSTLLILFLLPALYGILEDFGLAQAGQEAPATATA